MGATFILDYGMKSDDVLRSIIYCIRDWNGYPSREDNPSHSMSKCLRDGPGTLLETSISCPRCIDRGGVCRRLVCPSLLMLYSLFLTLFFLCLPEFAQEP